jgi:hypothetical protein
LGDQAAAELLFRRLSEVEAKELTLGPEDPDTLLFCNELATDLRKSGQAAWGEILQRRAATATTKARGESHPLSVHYRNNLVLCLVMQGKLSGARHELAALWKGNAPAHQNTTPPILFLRFIIALLESQSGDVFVGQLKTLLLGEPLPQAPNVAVPWDIGYFVDFLRQKLPDAAIAFLTALVAALNDRDETAKLDGFELWRQQPPVALDLPWPAEPDDAK